MDFEKGIEITCLDDFLKEITNLNENKSVEYSQLYFRGQKSDAWEVKPSIFRNDMLSIESNLMSEPLRKIPHEFKGLSSDFEIMEKYQHYGMATRLLDLTSNPLVALFFACESYQEEKRYENGNDAETTNKGIVYYKEVDLPLSYDSMEIKIVSRIASYDLNKEVTLERVIQNLYEDDIINEAQKDRYLSDTGITGFIKICQGVYTVLPIISNERLQRQNGLFILPGMYNVEKRETLAVSLLKKAQADMKSEFNNTFFYIEEENKIKIRSELVNYSISEAFLFPELEYQLRFIIEENQSLVKKVNSYEPFSILSEDSLTVEDSKVTFRPDVVNEVLEELNIDKILVDDVKQVFINNDVVDWFKKESIKSKIRVEIKNILKNENINQAEIDNYAKNIVERIIEKCR